MTARPTADLLEALADEIADMTEIARMIDEAVCEADLGRADGTLAADLQRVDFLYQHLRDVGIVLRKMAQMMEDGHHLDAVELGDAAQLDFLRRRLREDGDRHEKLRQSGHVDLF